MNEDGKLVGASLIVEFGRHAVCAGCDAVGEIAGLNYERGTFPVWFICIVCLEEIVSAYKHGCPTDDG